MDAQLTRLALSLAAQHGADGESIQDPPVPETLGRRLADEIRPDGIDAVVVWDNIDDVVLGHVVARELGARLVTAFADEGILGFDPAAPENARIALVAYSWSPYPGLDALLTALEHSGASVAVVCTLSAGSLASTEPPAGARTVAIDSLAAR